MSCITRFTICNIMAFLVMGNFAKGNAMFTMMKRCITLAALKVEEALFTTHGTHGFFVTVHV
jgi:hypothetical protein